ncbi:hypothetical protein CA13_16020 [Planctomycetes bacterium CA13]|uniref:Uncharacterized protein n=1 Tax=Novipirellula herctigrandis TaxID=2527986 RepID=A0A5C5YYJ9_9BACT|nr:hypothetical protein CA13_16020 [Planctomycetes bacterium CA13]
MFRALSITIVCVLVCGTFTDSPFAVEIQNEHKATLRVDASANCLFMTQKVTPAKHATKLQLRRGYEYRVTAEGNAYFSPQTGKDADRVPGVFVMYCMAHEVGHATRVEVLFPGKQLRFQTPNAESINSEQVFIYAFIVDYWDASENHGGFNLNVVGKPVGSGKSEDE